MIKQKNDWIEDKINNFVSEIKDKGIINSYPYIEIGDVELKKNSYIYKSKKSIKGCKLAKKGDILISKVRPNRGAIVLVKEDTINVSNAFCILRTKNEIIPKMLLFSLIENKFLNYLGEKQTGTLYPSCKSKDILDYHITYPKSKKEQQLIVDKIEKHFTRLDESVKSLTSLKNKLKIYKKSILKDIFNKIAIKKKLDNMCEKITQGPNPKLKNSEGKIGNYVLKTKDFYNYNILYEKCDSISNALIEEWKRFILKDGDVIIALVGVGSIGKINVFREQSNKKYMFTRATGLIRPINGEIDPEYIHYFFLSPQGSKLIDKGIGGSTGQLVIKTSYLKELEILAPSFKEQKKIVLEIESKFSIIEKIEKIVNKSLSKNEILKQSILKSAFEGELIKEMEIL